MPQPDPVPIANEEIGRVILFDTNFFRLLTKGSFNQVLADPGSDLRTALKTPITFWRTAFAFMEWIGLNSESLPKPSPFDPAAVRDCEFITPAYRHYAAHYETLGELDRENLEYLTARQRGYVTPLSLDVWDATIFGIFRENRPSSWLRFCLSFDAVHKLDVHEPYRSAYWSDLVAGGFFGADYRVRNLSKFRHAYRIWLRMKEKLTRPDASDSQRACIEGFHRELKMDPWKDYLDGDLVHAATYGAETEEQRYRVTCLTCDRPETVVARLRLYKGFLAFVHRLYRAKADEEGFPCDFASSHNGEVWCFDQSGALVRKIDVATEADPLSLT